jgi:hypothetical protein
MRYYKILDNNYILAIGTGLGGIEIIETEYNHILSLLHNIPIAPSGYAYRLTEELEWELYEAPIIEEEELATEEDYIAALEQLGVYAYA